MKKAYLLMFLVIAFICQANAADSDPKVKKMVSKIVKNFGKLDADGDGSLSEEELKRNIPENKIDALKEIFSKIDDDSDGKVSKEELQKAAK